jgi:hypothetical protein
VSIVRASSSAAAVNGLRDFMSNPEEWQESSFPREAFDPAQLREGAKSTGGIGGCPVAGFGILTPTTFALAPHGSSPSKAGLRRKTAEQKT